MESLNKELREMKLRNPHKFLKNFAAAHLINMGFKWNEIHEEYYVSSYLYQARVDVVGISNKKKVAIECGKTTKDRILLHLFFDEVYHLPYEREKPLQFTKEETQKAIDEHIQKLFDISIAYLEEARKFLRATEKQFYIEFLSDRWKKLYGHEKEA